MFTPEIIDAAKQHALEDYPKEACGIVSGGVYHRVPNVAEEPTLGFEMPPDTWLVYAPVEGVMHAHTLAKGGINVSKEDMAGYLSTGVPWGICLTNGVEITDHIWMDISNRDVPLLGRPFITGIFDCYSLAIGWFWQTKGIELKDWARDGSWWEEKDSNLFLDNLTEAGFIEIPRDEVVPGDGLLMQLGSSKINHCAVVLGGNLILHHLPGRLSQKDIYGNWIKVTRKAIRYVA